jgi:hypothetical protein
MDAQADLQTGLGMYRLDHGRGSPTEERLAQCLARLHSLLAALGNPMYQPATHPSVPEVVEVGSGHDEQTEDPDPESKAWSQGFDDGVITVLERLTRRAEVCGPDEAVALLNARDNIRERLLVERFGSSVSGGE